MDSEYTIVGPTVQKAIRHEEKGSQCKVGKSVSMAIRCLGYLIQKTHPFVTGHALISLPDPPATPKRKKPEKPSLDNRW